MPMPVETLRGHLTQAFPDAEIVIEDLAGDGDHYRARIISTAFEGLSRLARHRLVHTALDGKMGGEIHALTFDALTPSGD